MNIKTELRYIENHLLELRQECSEHLTTDVLDIIININVLLMEINKRLENVEKR